MDLTDLKQRMLDIRELTSWSEVICIQQADLRLKYCTKMVEQKLRLPAETQAEYWKIMGRVNDIRAGRYTIE